MKDHPEVESYTMIHHTCFIDRFWNHSFVNCDSAVVPEFLSCWRQTWVYSQHLEIGARNRRGGKYWMSHCGHGGLSGIVDGKLCLLVFLQWFFWHQPADSCKASARLHLAELQPSRSMQSDYGCFLCMHKDFLCIQSWSSLGIVLQKNGERSKRSDGIWGIF